MLSYIRRPTEGSSLPSKLRRNASASANISSLVSQSTSTNPGFATIYIPDHYVILQESTGNNVVSHL